MKPITTDRSDRKLNVLLWILQVLLAMLFTFAGVMKFVMSVEEMTKQIALPGWFLHFIGVAEILGAIGLVLPGILRIRTGLTPLAAAALAVIMIGATAVNLKTGQRGAALRRAGDGQSDVEGEEPDAQLADACRGAFRLLE